MVISAPPFVRIFHRQRNEEKDVFFKKKVSTNTWINRMIKEQLRIIYSFSEQASLMLSLQTNPLKHTLLL